jgi:hypothetical protein
MPLPSDGIASDTILEVISPHHLGSVPLSGAFAIWMPADAAQARSPPGSCCRAAGWREFVRVLPLSPALPRRGNRDVRGGQVGRRAATPPAPVRPPSTTSCVPVRLPARSEHR